MSRIKRAVLIAPKSTGGNFEYVAIPRQGLLFLSGALKQWTEGEYLYEREVWYEDRNGKINPPKDLDGADVVLITALINEAPRAYEIAKEVRAYYPEMPIIGGGPHMSPLFQEALGQGFDVIVQREGEDIIGPLCDTLIKHKGAARDQALRQITGITFIESGPLGQLVQTPRRGLLGPEYVSLPDFYAMRDLTPRNPLAAGVIETTRGCVENCSYCQVIQQFLGYRMVPRETEKRRLDQLQELANNGLIFANREGKFSVFISDDLHAPPLRATKFRNERLERLKEWREHTQNMWMIAQVRAEVGQDPELMDAMTEANIRMLYVGVESSNAKNLELVRKRQEPGQVEKDLAALNARRFVVTAMTIIGLPFDTEQTIMEMAGWARSVSKYQTANLLTPLPATVNWDTLTPLDEDGSILAPGKMRPYELYTGRQLVHLDSRWSMQESQQLFEDYTGKLRPVDTMYERIFRMFKMHTHRLATVTREAGDKVSSTLSDLKSSIEGASHVKRSTPASDQ